ncbi:MAG: hypothetical protein GC151_18375 [Betaproteobacteria bacterium]|nr:hypothetical protein [Betaproteobacteria bacterium]
MAGQTPQVYLLDALNSVTQLVDAGTASVTSSFTYEPYGTARFTGLDSLFRFTGREDDSPTGLMYYRARYYAPLFGRFASEDPIGFVGGYNLYRYVHDNPTGTTDPKGKFGPVVALGVLAAIGAFGEVALYGYQFHQDWELVKEVNKDAGIIQGACDSEHVDPECAEAKDMRKQQNKILGDATNTGAKFVKAFGKAIDAIKKLCR